MESSTDIAVDIAVIKNTLAAQSTQLRHIDETLSRNYATIDRVTVVERRVNTLYSGIYWFLGVIGFVGVTAILRLIIK